VRTKTDHLAIACGKLELVGMSKSHIENFKPPSADDPVLSEIVRRLSEAYHPLRIYLFGSAARGDAGPDSDYDLMVILPDEAPEHLRRGNAGYRALRGTGVAADVQVWPQGDFNRQLHLKASFPSTIVREGKLLYGA
jgi:predicted nucleotidyltransferase